MLVSTLRPSRRAQTLAPLPRWQMIRRDPLPGRGPRALQQPPGDVAVARCHESRSGAGAGGRPGPAAGHSARRLRQGVVEGGVEDGRRPERRAAGRCPASITAASGGLCSGSRRARPRSALQRPPASRGSAAAKRGAAMHHPMPDRVDPQCAGTASIASCAACQRSPSPARRGPGSALGAGHVRRTGIRNSLYLSVALPAFSTRMFMILSGRGARVPRRAGASSGQSQSRTSGMSSPHGRAYRRVLDQFVPQILLQVGRP